MVKKPIISNRFTPEFLTGLGSDLDIKQTKKWIEQYFEDIPSSIKDIPRPNIVEACPNRGAARYHL